ncbi:MAG TPA: alpha/beta hydrolase [Pseudomonadota bacterium]|nr:alpha/beta hydrolase [Pseudomonadota bacterium]HNI59708.1 alpha/beta hydrolase [Pseudomonadota bacterium]HNN52241.1 alpha/beta hydrolase [Pseudomonadota bacterium]HNO67686.1 alpha/beta hydrolase [Pseudomonadota bacterium]
MHSHSVHSQDVSIAYRVIGAGPRDVMLVHGWMVSGAVYDDLVGALDTEGLRLILVDLRGSGKSGRPQSGYTIEQYAKDVLAVADAVGSRKFMLVGHSMGGQIAQWIAATAPERVLGMVLLCPVPASGIPLPPDAQALFRNCGQNRSMQQTILGLACKQLSDEARERLLDDAQGVSVECVAQAFDTWTAGGFSDRLGAIVTPTLVVGTDDPFLPPSFLRQAVVSLIRGARLSVLPGPGHYVQVERPRETAALVEAFLAALPHP